MRNFSWLFIGMTGALSFQGCKSRNYNAGVRTTTTRSAAAEVGAAFYACDDATERTTPDKIPFVKTCGEAASDGSSAGMSLTGPALKEQMIAVPVQKFKEELGHLAMQFRLEGDAFVARVVRIDDKLVASEKSAVASSEAELPQATAKALEESPQLNEGMSKGAQLSIQKEFGKLFLKDGIMHGGMAEVLQKMRFIDLPSGRITYAEVPQVQENFKFFQTGILKTLESIGNPTETANKEKFLQFLTEADAVVFTKLSSGEFLLTLKYPPKKFTFDFDGIGQAAKLKGDLESATIYFDAQGTPQRYMVASGPKRGAGDKYLKVFLESVDFAKP